MPLEILALRAYDGPNAYGPQPGLLLRLFSEKDRTRRLRDALKDGAQAAGLVIAFLECNAAPIEGGYLLMCHFGTPQPAIAADLARYVVEGINRTLAGDEEWDADGPLFAIQKRRRREATPLALLQLAAEARRHGLPLLRTPDGQAQIGYGARGWSFDAGQLAQGAAIAPPWGEIGVVPVVALCGAGAEAVVALVAGGLAPHPVAVRVDADFDAARAALCDPQAEAVVLGLAAESIVARGVPFDRCAASAIVSPGPTAIGASGRDEHLRALGVPMLLTDPAGRVVLGDDPELRALAGFAPCPVVTVGAQRSEDGAAEVARVLLAALGLGRGKSFP